MIVKNEYVLNNNMFYFFVLDWKNFSMVII